MLCSRRSVPTPGVNRWSAGLLKAPERPYLLKAHTEPRIVPTVVRDTRASHLPVFFHLERPCPPGHRVSVLGDVPELNNWKEDSVPTFMEPARYDKREYARWMGPRQDGDQWCGWGHLPIGKKVQFKFVYVDDKGHVTWPKDVAEVGGTNLELDVKEGAQLRVGSASVQVGPATAIEYKEEGEQEEECSAPQAKQAEAKEARGYTGLLPVVFKLKKVFQPGERVGVVGDIPELSIPKWNTKEVRVLMKYLQEYDRWDDYGYGPDGPLWYGQAWVPWGQDFQFKFVLLDANHGNAFKRYINEVVGPENLKLRVDPFKVLEKGDVCVEVQPTYECPISLDDLYEIEDELEARQAEECKKDEA